MEEILVSIIIPTYNVEKFLYRGIESCINQTYKNIEIIIIDDGSTDNTQNIIKKYSQKDSRIKYFFQENNGVSNARNKGLGIATGDYIIFLDSDDWLELQAVECLLEIRNKNRNCFIICDRYFAYLDTDNSIFKEAQNQKEKEIKLSKKNMLLNIGTGRYNLQSACYKLFSKKILDENKLKFRENIYHGEDGLFVFEYTLCEDNVFYANKALWNILERPNSVSRGKFNKKFFTAITAVEEMIKLVKNDETLGKVLKKYLYIRAKGVFYTGIRDNALNEKEKKALKVKIKQLEKSYFEDIEISKKIKYYIGIRLPEFFIKFLLKLK